MSPRPASFLLAFCCAASTAVAAPAHEAGEKSAYDRAAASAKAAYDSAAPRCDSRSGHARDLCLAEAKLARTRVEAEAEAAYRNTPAARQHANEEVAEAQYKVTREQCNERSGNDKDVCVRVAKAELAKTKADAKANSKIAEARSDAAKDKRDADYQVAAEKCDALGGDAKSACLGQAKARFGR